MLDAIFTWLAGDAGITRWMVALLVTMVAVEHFLVGLAIKALRESSATLRAWAGTPDSDEAKR